MLTVEKLNQHYGSSQTLRDVSFTAPLGACTAVLGRNGVGKTTLLRCLMGLVPVTSGSISFDGVELTDLPPFARARLGLGYVPQGREIFPRLTVEENIIMALAMRKDHDGIPDDIFQMFPVLKQMLRRRGGDLSGGQQQQLAIARALVMKPKVLILDEPTEGIQPSIIKDIERVIRMLSQRGDMAILLVEQYYEFARDLANELAVMVRGEIVISGPIAEIPEHDVRRHLTV